jgi:hypothetical protein
MIRQHMFMRFSTAAIWLWLTSDNLATASGRPADDCIDWLRCSPFIAMHLGCLAVFLVGISPIAIVVAALLFLLRMFFITGFYHRYFSHRTFKTSRAMQLVFAMALKQHARLKQPGLRFTLSTCRFTTNRPWKNR